LACRASCARREQGLQPRDRRERAGFAEDQVSSPSATSSNSENMKLSRTWVSLLALRRRRR
jgi:hypothetical protein